jgi:hypothetical protein
MGAAAIGQHLANAPKRATPPGVPGGAQGGSTGEDLGFDGIAALPVLALGRSDGQAHFLADRGAGHIMHMLRNLSRFTINGSICSGRVFLSCVECGARTGTV